MNPSEGRDLRFDEKYLKPHRPEREGKRRGTHNYVLVASWISLSSSAGFLVIAIVAQKILAHERKWSLAYDILSAIRIIELISITLGVGALIGATKFKMSHTIWRSVAGVVIGLGSQIVIYAGLLASGLGNL